MSFFFRNGLLFTFLIVFLSLTGKAQTLPPEISTFSMKKHKTHGQIFCAQALPSGRTAFGTYRSILFYNGEGFNRVSLSSGKYVTSMDLGPNGRLFYGGHGTLGYLSIDSTGSFVPHSLKEELPDSLRPFAPIWSVQSKENKLRFLSKEELITFHRDSLQVHRPEKTFIELLTPEGKAVVQDGDRGLFLLKEEKKHLLPGSEKFLKKDRVVRNIIPSVGKKDGWIIFLVKGGTYEYHRDEGRFRPFPSGSRNGSSTLRDLDWEKLKAFKAIQLDPEKNPYGAAYAIGTNHGGVVLAGPSGKVSAHFRRKDGCPSNSIWDLESDKRGNFWASTDNGIALFHTGTPFTLAREGEWFKGSLNAVGRPFYGDQPLLLSSLQGLWGWRKESGTFELMKGTSGYCFDLTMYREGRSSPEQAEKKGMRESTRWIAAGGNSGVLSVIPGKGEGLGKARTIFQEHVGDVASLPHPNEKGPSSSGSKGAIVSGGRKGLFVHVPNKRPGKWKWELIMRADELPDAIGTLAWEYDRQDPDSLWVWAGLRSQGLLKVSMDTALTGYHITHFDSTSGLPQGSVWTFPDPSSDQVVFGTDRGLYHYEDGKMKPDCRYGNIFCNGGRQLFLIKEGNDGEVWIDDGTSWRIKRLIPTKDGYQIDSLPFRFLDIGNIQTIYPEEKRIWFGADRGLACYYSDMERNYDKDWNCLIEKVINGKERHLFNGHFNQKASQDGILSSWRDVGFVQVEEQSNGNI
ncbi:MAG: hypothetical protein ABEH38_01130, partial [Flavobacteriales bacterium]